MDRTVLGSHLEKIDVICCKAELPAWRLGGNFPIQATYEPVLKQISGHKQTVPIGFLAELVDP